MSEHPVKFGSVSAQTIPSMLWNEAYDDERDLILDLAAIINKELRELAAAGCPVIQVEEPQHHFRALNPNTSKEDMAFLNEAFNREVEAL